MRRAIACAALSLCALGGTPARAHHSASSTGAFLLPRSTACSEPKLHDPRCVGPQRAMPLVVAQLRRSPRGAPRRLHEAAIAAAYYDLREAIEPLRDVLRLQHEPHEHALWRLRAEAAYALAQLDDRSSVHAIASLVEALEVHGSGTLWIDTLEALAQLDAEEASRYAVDFLGRVESLVSFRVSMPGGTSKDRVLAHLRPGEQAALPALQRLTEVESVSIRDDRTFCKLMAARMRAGDARLRAQTRKTMSGSYSGTSAASCDADWLGVFGTEPEDAAVLVRHLGRPDAGLDHPVTNVAYGQILELLARMNAALPNAGAAERRRIEAARRTIRAALLERADWPHLRDPTHRAWAQHFPVLQAAALAALGDEAARGDLLRFVGDPDDRTGTAWIAALWGLRLQLRVDDAVAALMARGGTYRNAWRSGLYRDLRVRVLDEWLARQAADPRWTVALVDAELDVAERALARLSRDKPIEACRLVLAASRDASREAAERGISTLLALGDACRSDLEATALDVRAPSKVRGPALELSAVLGWPRTREVAERAYSQSNMPPYVGRARRMADALDGPTR